MSTEPSNGEGETNQTPRDATTAAQGKIIFRSGFESGVSVQPPIAPSGQWRQLISGEDEGYNWNIHLAEIGGYAAFQYLVPSQTNIDDYVDTQIDTVIGPDGSDTKALFIAIKTYDETGFGRGWLSRNQYVLPIADAFQQAYVRYWVKFQPDLETVMSKTGAWRNMMEWSESGETRTDYRWAIYIIKNPYVSEQLFWKVEGEEIVPQRRIDWQKINTTVAIPVDEWFLLEVFWKHSTSDGHVWVSINGETIADHRGRTKRDSPLTSWSLFKVYTNTLDAGPAYQWIDDVEIHTDMPVSRLER